MSISKALKPIVTPPVASAFALLIPVVPTVALATGSPADALVAFALLFVPCVIVSALWFGVAAPLVDFTASALPFHARANFVLGSVVVGCAFLVPFVLLASNLISVAPGHHNVQNAWWLSVAIGLGYGTYLGLVTAACTLVFGRDS